MPQVVVFDVDGTLVDSVDLHAEAWRRAFREFGKDIPFARVRYQIGKGSDQLLPEFWSRAELEEIRAPMSEFRSRLYERDFLPRVRAFPAVRELFERLLERGLRVGLASSAQGAELQTYKERARITDLVEAETSKDDVAASKPEPDVIEAALRKLGGPPPEESIFVGDTPWDLIAARKARVPALAVLCGGFPAASLADAVAIYQDPADLLGKLEISPIGAGDRR